MPLRRLTLDELSIDDDDAFRGVALYRDMVELLRRERYRFAVPAPGAAGAFWSRALFLNLTFWGGESDVLVDKRVPADVVVHVGLHLAVRRWLAAEGLAVDSADALFLGEAVASAADLYLAGRLFPLAPECGFLETQVPAMSEAALDAGLDERGVEALFAEVAADPDAAFRDACALLFDAATSLVGVTDLDAAAAELERLQAHRFGPLLHHYELSNWILHARARGLARDPAVAAVAARVDLETLGRV